MTTKKPYLAVVHLTIEVHDLLETGECSGHVLSPKELSEFDIKPKMLVSVKGFDKFDCLKKLKSKIESFNG